MVSPRHPQFEELMSNPEPGIRRVPLIVSHLDDPDLRPALDKLRDTFGAIWEVNDLGLRIQLVNQGVGISYVDGRILTDNPDCREFELLADLPFAEIPLTFGLFSKKAGQLSAGAKQFVAICQGYAFDG